MTFGTHQFSGSGALGPVQAPEGRRIEDVNPLAPESDQAGTLECREDAAHDLTPRAKLVGQRLTYRGGETFAFKDNLVVFEKQDGKVVRLRAGADDGERPMRAPTTPRRHFAGTRRRSSSNQCCTTTKPVDDESSGPSGRLFITRKR